jgi:hypothetical protein
MLCNDLSRNKPYPWINTHYKQIKIILNIYASPWLILRSYRFDRSNLSGIEFNIFNISEGVAESITQLKLKVKIYG